VGGGGAGAGAGAAEVVNAGPCTQLLDLFPLVDLTCQLYAVLAASEPSSSDVELRFVKKMLPGETITSYLTPGLP